MCAKNVHSGRDRVEFAKILKVRVEFSLDLTREITRLFIR